MILFGKELANLISSNEPDYTKLAGGIRIKDSVDFDHRSKAEIQSLHENIDLVKNFLSEDDCKQIVSIFESYGTYAPVTVQGMQEVTDDNVGSKRITAFSPEIAHNLFIKMYYDKLFRDIKICDEQTPTDWHQDGSDKEWEFVGISPMLRFMKYEKGGKHYPHYDAGFIYPQNTKYRTLKSFVLYLTTNQSGATRFIDGKISTPIWDRDHSDWNREPNQDEIIDSILPVKGDLLIFDHRICHDVSEYNDPTGERIIIRGDLIYKRYDEN